jgi:cytochrome P450 family 6
VRFAVLKMKMALVSILRDYKFQVAPDTEIPLKLNFKMILSSANGIYLKVIKINC